MNAPRIDRVRTTAAMAMAVALTTGPRTVADAVFTDNFNAADQSLAAYDSNYIITANATATITANKLRVLAVNGSTSSEGVTSYSGLGAVLGGTSHGEGSFLACDVKVGPGPELSMASLGGSVHHYLDFNYDIYNQRSAYYEDDTSTAGWEVGGSTPITRGTERQFAIVYVGSATAHLFFNNTFNCSFTDVAGSDNDVGPSGNETLTLRTRHTYSPDANNWVEFDNLVVGRNAFTGSGAGVAIKAGLSRLYSDNFDRANGPIGDAWTYQSGHGTCNIGIVNNAVEIEIATSDGSNPWGAAYLDLTHSSVLGRGLAVGEYLEVYLKRNQDYGGIGTKTPGTTYFSQDAGNSAPLRHHQDRFGSDQGSAWCVVSPAGYNTNAGVTLGYLLGYASGSFMIVHFYVNDNYAGTWLYNTGATNLGSFSLAAQTGTVGHSFTFDNLTVYGVAKKGTVILLR
jgi:hypothetical protein